MKSKFKSSINKLLLLGLIMLTLFSVVACGSKTKEKEFKSDAGLTITLNTNFYEKSIASQTMYLESKDSIFCALKEEFENLSAVELGAESTIEEYATQVKENNLITSELKTQDSLSYMDYSKTVTGREFFYRAYIFKGTDAFWLCQFACVEAEKDAQIKNFTTWAKTIVVK